MEGDREDAASRGNITDLFTISSPVQPEVSSVETPLQQTQFGSIPHRQREEIALADTHGGRYQAGLT